MTKIVSTLILKAAMAIFFLGLCFPARAYVTSATLELVADDKAGAYLNGRNLLDDKKCEMICNWFVCLSTSDGTLPLELFKNNEDNLLGIIAYDVFGGDLFITYRLTVNHSNGDPIVIWGEPGKTRFFHRFKGEPDPANWFTPDFDDSKWPFAIEMLTPGGHFIRMPDPHMSTFLGSPGYLPRLGANSSGSTAPAAHLLYRNHFNFPNSIAKADLRINPKTAAQNQQVAIRIIPGRDAADISNFTVFADLPKGLEPAQILDRGTYDSASRRVRWQYRDIGKAAKYTSLPTNAVINGGSWKSPERALGAFKPELLNTLGSNTPVELLNRGASFWPAQPAWFRVATSPFADGPESPAVLGVIFKLQYLVGGSNNPFKIGVNDIFLNYSVDGSMRPTLPVNKQVSHASDSNSWMTGYYDATEDRKWTWKDINNLVVMLESKQSGNRALGHVASLYTTVRSLKLQDCAPALLAKVSSARCEDLHIKAGLFQADGKASASDSFILPVNQRACATATPVPPPPTPLPGNTAVPTPLPTPTPGPRPVPPETIGLSCLQTSPEPFRRGGVFVYFCLKVDADITLEVTDSAGRVVRTLPSVTCRAGNSQIFFNAMNNAGVPIAPGTYIYNLKAATTDGMYTSSRHSNFTRAAESFGR